MVLDILIKNIHSVNHDGIEYKPNKIDIKRISNKYSSSGLSTFKLVIDDELILSRNDKVSYLCPTCHKKVTILVQKFLNKDTLYCRSCKEQDEIKRLNQSKYLTQSYEKFRKIKSKERRKFKLDQDEFINFSKELFDSESDRFKSNYLSRVISKDDFNKVKQFISKIDGIDISNASVEYYPIVKNNNQMKYSPKVLIDGVLHTLSDCEFKCQICGKEFRGRNILDKCNKGVLCKECSFSNEKFKFKSHLNINGDKVVYQSEPELRLIKHYNNIKIVIENGPRVNYFFDGKERIYRVDFMVRSNKMIIEVKDNHKWHKDEVKSGKWQAKENAARDWCSKNGYTYHLLFDVDVIINTNI